MTDLTKITTPFGLLDAETREALQVCGGPWEYFSETGWVYVGRVMPRIWLAHIAYRQVAPPPKPREWWIVTEDKTGRRWVHDTLVGLTRTDVSAVRVREVLSDD